MIKYRAQKNYLNKQFCNNLVNEGKDFFDNHISGGDVIHGGRNFIPNTSLDWHELCKKKPSWKKLNEKLNSQDFLDYVSGLFDEKDEEFKCIKLYSKKRKFSSNLNQKVKIAGIKTLIGAIIYKCYLYLSRHFLSLYSSIFENKTSLELLIDFSIASKGYTREIHRDSNNRKFVFLIYLNSLNDSAEEGGEFVTWKLKDNVDSQSGRPNQDDCEVIEKISPEPGKLIIFKNDNYSFHSVSKMTSSENRFFIYGGFTQLSGKNRFMEKYDHTMKTEFNIYL